MYEIAYSFLNHFFHFGTSYYLICEFSLSCVVDSQGPQFVQIGKEDCISRNLPEIFLVKFVRVSHAA